MKKTITCKTCSKMFVSYNPNPIFCCLKCKAISQQHYINDSLVINLYKSGLTQIEVAAKLNTTRKVVENSMKRTGTARRIAAKRDQWGDKNHMWKGERAGYSCLHKRLHRRYGKACKCEVCGTTDKRKSYDYANLTGDYADEKDYKQMCRSCHWKFDGTIFNINKMRIRQEVK